MAFTLTLACIYGNDYHQLEGRILMMKGKKVVTLEETKIGSAETSEETIIRYKNEQRPVKADSTDMMTDFKQHCVGDYSCCSHMP